MKLTSISEDTKRSYSTINGKSDKHTRKKKEVAAHKKPSKIKEAKEASKPSAPKKKDKIEEKKDTKSVAAPTIVKATPSVLPPSDEEIARMLFAEINGMRRRG